MLSRVFVLCTGESFNNSLEGECETYLLRNFNIIERVTGYLTIYYSLNLNGLGVNS